MAIITPYNHTKYTSPIQELLETVSLYLHIPFCHTRCHYCDFNTYAGILPLREPYIRALLTEIELAGQLAQRAGGTPRRSRTIFFGGGTPSLLSVAQVTRLLNACRKAFAVDEDAEITLEANPGTLSFEQLAGLRAAGAASTHPQKLRRHCVMHVRQDLHPSTLTLCLACPGRPCATGRTRWTRH